MSDYNFCPACGEGLVDGGNYCPSCGKPLRTVPSPPQKKNFEIMDAFKILGAWSSALLLCLLTVYVAIALWISPEIVANIGDGGYPFFILVPFILVLFIAEGWLAVVSFLIILAILVASFILLAWKSPGILREMSGDFSNEPSPLFKVGTLFAAVLFFNYLFYFLITVLGNEPSSPDFSSMDDWRLLFVLLNASVYEELISRTLLIGVPLSIMVLMNKREGSWFRPLFGGTGMGDAEKILIVFSALFFALGHYQGWDLWKLLPTFLAGLAMGYLFVKYGLYASVMFHFSFNFLSAPMVYSDSLLVLFLLGVTILGFLGLGFPFFLIYAKEAIESVTGKPLFPPRDGENEDSQVGDAVEEYRMPSPVCPSCGQKGALYRQGNFECPRCGKRY